MKLENGDGAQAVRLSRQMLRRGAALAALFGIGMLAVLLARLYRLQISQHDFYESLALEQQLRETKGAVARGTITDTNGNPLAVSATEHGWWGGTNRWSTGDFKAVRLLHMTP